MFGSNVQIILGPGWPEFRLPPEAKPPPPYKQMRFWSSSTGTYCFHHCKEKKRHTIKESKTKQGATGRRKGIKNNNNIMVKKQN
jgi:hypothetical protein